MSLATVDCMHEFHGIVFRDGPTGRRAALASGPDVWELMAAIKSGKARGEEAIAATAELLNLTESQVRTAVRYYDAFPDEIDQRIALNTAVANPGPSTLPSTLVWRAGRPPAQINPATRLSLARLRNRADRYGSQ